MSGETTNPEARESYLRALSHPARWGIIEALSAGRELTATECSAFTGLSPSAVSYHMRALERWGLITRGQASDDGRKRIWRLREPAFSLSGASGNSSTVQHIIGQVRDDLDRILERTEDRGTEFPTILESTVLHVDANGAQAVAATLSRVLNSLPAAGGEESPGSTGGGPRRLARVTILFVPGAEVDRAGGA